MSAILKNFDNDNCWYCNRNEAESKYSCNEKYDKTEVKLKAPYKEKRQIYKSWKIPRCKRCYRSHKIMENISDISFLSLFVLFYVLQCFIEAGEWIKYIIFIFTSLLFSLLLSTFITNIVSRLIALAHNTKIFWSMGGSIFYGR